MALTFPVSAYLLLPGVPSTAHLSCQSDTFVFDDQINSWKFVQDLSEACKVFFPRGVVHCNVIYVSIFKMLPVLLAEHVWPSEKVAGEFFISNGITVLK